MSYRAFQSTIGANDDNDRTDWSRLQIDRISQNVNQIQRMINQLGSPQDSESFTSKLHEVKQYTNQLARDANNLRQSANQSTAISDHSLLNSSSVSRRAPYFESKPVFGGHYVSRAARLAGTTPYNLSQRHQLAPALKVNVNPTKRVLGISDPLSSSSKRILEKLEKASTPLQDARRIPHSASFKDYFQTSDLLHRSSKRPKLGPPTHATPVVSQTIERTFQPKRWELKLVYDNEVSKPSHETTEQIINSCDNKYLNDMKEFKSSDSFGGKMTRKDLKRDERRGKPQSTIEEAETDSFDLLANTQPLIMPSNLPKFSFGTNSTTKPLTTIITKTSETSETDSEFKFAEPVLKKKNGKRKLELDDETIVGNADKPFVFSSPLSAITPNLSNGLENVKNSSVGWGDKFKPKTGSWDCPVCCVNNDSDKTNCVACEEPNPGSKSVTLEPKKKEVVHGLGEKWICVCLFQNASCDNKCKACNKSRIITPKPSEPSVPALKSTFNDNNTPFFTSNGTVGWGDKFKPKTGSWDCPVCCVNNGSDKTKCVACEEPQPGAKSGPKEASKGLSESWQCFYCKETNDSLSRCKSCDKIKTPIASKADLDKLYVGQTFKFGITEEEKVKTDKQMTKASDEKSESTKRFVFKSSETTAQTSSTNTISNSFVFGSTAVTESSKPLSDSNIFKVGTTSTTSDTAFKFGFSSTPSKPLSDPKPTEHKTSSVSDIFSSTKTTSSPAFTFGALANTASNAVPQTTASNLSSESPPQLFTFGSQDKDQDLSKTKKNVSFNFSENTDKSLKTTNKSSTDSSLLGFQFGKSPETTTQAFKGFNTSSPSLFSATTGAINTAVTTVTTVSITSFIDKKSTTLKPTEPQTQTTGYLFGAPASTTSSSITSFSSPFSAKTSGITPTTTSGQPSSDQSAPKSLFSFNPSSSAKPFDSILSNQSNPLVTSSTTLPSIATLSSSTSSSMPNGLVFGSSSNTALPSFSSPASTATTKPNFSFNINPTTAATTTSTAATTENTFGTTNALFGSNPNKNFSFGNTLNSNQTPSFSFNPQPNTTISNTPSTIGFGLKSNTSSNFSANTETTSKPVTNPLFAFGPQSSDQFSSSAQKPLNNIDTNPKSNSQFSFGLSSNPTTGQPNSTSNLFGNAITNAPQNSLSFNQLQPSSTSVANPSAFNFGSNAFGTAQPTPQMPLQPQPQSLATPQFNFSAQPTFNFGQTASTGAQPGGPNIFQFSADQSAQAVVPNRNIKKAKRRLNPT